MPHNITHREMPAVIRTDVVTRQLASIVDAGGSSSMSRQSSQPFSLSDDGGVTAAADRRFLTALQTADQDEVRELYYLSQHRRPASVTTPAPSTTGLNLDKHDIMCRHLYNSCTRRHWLETLPDGVPSIALRVDHEVHRAPVASRPMSSASSQISASASSVSEQHASLAAQASTIDDTAEYRVFPPTSSDVEGAFFADRVAGLNVKVCVRLSYTIVNVILSYMPDDAVAVPLSDNTRIQILDSIVDLPRARKHQYAAFVREEQCLLVWSDDVTRLLSLASMLESRMMELVWQPGSLEERFSVPTAAAFEANPFESREVEEGAESVQEKTEEDPELAQVKKRPSMLLQALTVGLAILILFTFIGLMMRTIAKEIKADGNYLRLLAVLYILPFSLLCAFFCVAIAGVVVQFFGPVSQMRSNSLTFSAIRPPRLSASKIRLPHITIQCPVYKESLAGVINPTIQSIMTAVTTYELQGGSASIFVNDDGMQLIPEDEAAERRAYYAEHLIGWVARPPHGRNGFERRGRFKKASNMNYSLNISNRVEEKLEKIERHEKWTDLEEEAAYENALREVIAEENGECLAAGDIRIGDLILLIDSDTRVPEDCFLDAASEFYYSPEIAILQQKSGVMMVVHNYWEELIAWFTRLIYFAIQYATAGGDAAAFVGHNAFLRWSALQELAYEDKTDNNRVKYWSEQHVSEDFEVSLKLQTKGYTIRLVSYTNDQFEEGVSLTVYDELTRWQKYAYGCNELMFRPAKYWLTGRVFTPLFWNFLTSNIKFFQKFTIIAYIGTYYAIAASLFLSTLNYFLIGWLEFELDQIYLSSFNNFLSLVVVFSGASPIVNALVRYRTKETTFFKALVENVMYGFMMMIFLGGLPWHLNLAFLSHIFGFNMQWGATAKELESSNFFREFPKIVRGFKYMYIVLFGLVAGMLALAYGVPWNWRITGFYPSLPLGWAIASHILTPIVLNPQLMTFSF
ncbi:putative glycosyltransferase family 2 protein [Myxozyma melibiosi]|uniref:Glycosyltransferase family 2 protein n=1 Tax=Myxozyma melibiosi TaxID=54550 RepID=A0ABR1F012_9ASCO